MKKETIIALRGSIRKWDLIAQGIGLNEGGSNCPLCKMFCRGGGWSTGDCKECPVFLVTKNTQCGGTPYTEFVGWAGFDFEETLPEMGLDKYKMEMACDACEREIEFLIGLLPEKARRKYEA